MSDTAEEYEAASESASKRLAHGCGDGEGEG